MSRAGQIPVPIPAGVEVKLNGKILSVKGPKGMLTREIPDVFEIRLEPGLVAIKPKVYPPMAAPEATRDRRRLLLLVRLWWNRIRSHCPEINIEIGLQAQPVLEMHTAIGGMCKNAKEPGVHA